MQSDVLLSSLPVCTLQTEVTYFKALIVAVTVEAQFKVYDNLKYTILFITWLSVMCGCFCLLLC